MDVMALHFWVALLAILVIAAIIWVISEEINR
jgi:hypothetical protein